LASWPRSRNLIDTPRSPRSIAAFLACWVTHAESGCAVTPTATTRLVLSWMKNSTYNRLSHTVSMVRRVAGGSHTPRPSQNRA
jgi:hypothetical protein